MLGKTRTYIEGKRAKEDLGCVRSSLLGCLEKRRDSLQLHSLVQLTSNRTSTWELRGKPQSCKQKYLAMSLLLHVDHENL